MSIIGTAETKGFPLLDIYDFRMSCGESVCHFNSVRGREINNVEIFVISTHISLTLPLQSALSCSSC